MESLFILGRQPSLGLAELESLYGSGQVKPAGSQAALLAVDPSIIDFDRLGGSIKFGRVLATLPSTDWREVEKWLAQNLPQLAEALPEGKITLGISAYDIRVSPAAIQAAGLTLKKVIRKSGRSVRLVPNKELELNTAQVLHNNLDRGNGWEILVVRDGSQTILGQTIRVQDIESYTIRDRERPKRDARVGMLPPKLAQIIINLARPSAQGTILDPFCGTGVLLQEALLMDFSAYGSDLEPRMIEYTKTNLEWLKAREPWLAKNIDELKSTHIYLEVQDATTFQNHDVIDAVACETYLGRPFTSTPSPEVLHQTVSDVNLIIKKFLKTIRSQVPSGTRMCIAVPAWQTRPGQFKHLHLLDSLGELGYNRTIFEHVSSRDLLYYRADQVVARELLVLETK